MRAVTIVGHHLVWAERPDPEPEPGQLLVAVRAAGVNAADLLQLRGLYPAPPGVPPDAPGLELAGVVVARPGAGVAGMARPGAGVERFGPGDRVMAVVGGGAHAELAVVPEGSAMAVPTEVPWEEAGGFPETFTTAHDALFTQCQLTRGQLTRGQLTRGERVLVSGGAGGVGTAAVQLAAAAGAQVVATVRRSEHREAVAALGAAAAAASGLGGQVWAVAPEEAAGHGPYDVVLELVGAPNLAGDLEGLATGGRIAVIGVGAGSRAEIDLRVLMARRARIHGSTLRARSGDDKAASARALEADVASLLAARRVRVPLAGVYPMERAADAYRRFGMGAKLGKIVLTNRGLDAGA